MLKGIDVSKWQEFASGKFTNAVVEQAYQDSDFVIVKATQGVSYVNSTNCDKIIQRCINDGKLWGFYHYAGGNDAEKEAKWFYDNCLNYFGDGIPCLDFESSQNDAWDDGEWALDFVNALHDLTQVWPLVYTSAAYVSRIKSCAPYCGLWVAGYPDSSIKDWGYPDFEYSIEPWGTYTVWQYTNSAGIIDRDVARLTFENWGKIARGDMGTAEAEDESGCTCSCCCKV